MTVRWSDQAVNDLDEIYEYIEQDKPDAAVEMARQIVELTDRLARLPRMGRVTGRRHKEFKNVFEMVHPPYIIFYVIENDTVLLLSVMEGHRRRD